MDPLIQTLRRVRRRLTLVRAMETGLAGGVGAGVLGIMLAAIRILAPRALPEALVHPAWPIAFVPAGFALAFLVRLAMGVSLRRAAIAADRAGQLKDRLATALEVLEATTRPPGILDERLLVQARAAAEHLDVGVLRLARAVGRRGRAVLVVLLVLVAAAFIPSLAGPPISPPAASRAAETLARAARDPREVAPQVRRALDQAVTQLLAEGVRQSDADAATTAVRDAAIRAAREQRTARQVLAEIPNAEFQAMLQAASQGDGQGATAAARALADRLRPSGAGGMPPEERQRLAEDLDRAARAMDEAGLARLAENLRAAALAAREPPPSGRASPQSPIPDAEKPLRRLADAMTEALPRRAGMEGSGAEATATVLAAVREARRTLGLAEMPMPTDFSPVADAMPPDADAFPLTPGTEAEKSGPPHTRPPAAGQGGQAIAPSVTPVPSEVRPEDRDVVRRYFGG